MGRGAAGGPRHAAWLPCARHRPAATLPHQTLVGAAALVGPGRHRHPPAAGRGVQAMQAAAAASSAALLPEAQAQARPPLAHLPNPLLLVGGRRERTGVQLKDKFRKWVPGATCQLVRCQLCAPASARHQCRCPRRVRSLVKFRHISAEESRTIKPKSGGPWSRKYSTGGAMQRDRYAACCCCCCCLALRLIMARGPAPARMQRSAHGACTARTTLAHA